MKAKYLFAILLLSFFSEVKPAAGSEEQIPVRIVAQKVEGSINTKITASGKVKITYGDVTIIGDRAEYNREEGLIRVRGNVIITEGEAKLHCSSIVYNLNTKRAVIEKVKGKISENGYLKADRVERLSDKEWIAYDGEYTPCSHNCPDWSIGAKRFKILLGESFKGKWVTFRVKEIPVLVTPALSGPIKKRRSSGFLIPRIGYMSKDGFIYRQPFYIVLGRSADATFAYEKRFKNGNGKYGEFRYVLSEKNKGELSYYQIDKSRRKDWKFTLDHRLHESESFYGTASVELVNSREYYKSTTSFDVEEKTQVYTKSEVNLSKLWEHAILNFNTVFLDYLDGSTDTIYQKLPEFNFYLMDTPLFKTPFTFSLDSQLTYFYRKAGGSSYRLNAAPALRLSTALGNGIKNTLKATTRLTAYQSGGTRTVFEFEDRVSSYTYLPLEKFSVSLNPELTFKYTEVYNQENTPFYDESDRIEERKLLIPGLLTYFYSSDRQVARLSVNTDFDLENGDDIWDGANVNFDFSPVPNFSLSETFFISSDSGLEESNTFLRTSLKGASAWLNFFYQKGENRYVRWGTEIPLNSFLKLSYQQRYDVKLSEDREREYAVSVNRGCWNGRLSYRWVKNFDSSTDYQILLTVNLLRLGSYGYKLTGRRD